MPGSGRSRPKFSAEAGFLLCLLSHAAAAADPQHGREIFLSRQTGLCLLCHAGPSPDPGMAGNLAPDLTGVGSRLSAAELEKRLTSPEAFNPDTIMPSYSRTRGFANPAAAFEGRPLLKPEEIQDVVAYLQSLH